MKTNSVLAALALGSALALPCQADNFAYMSDEAGDFGTIDLKTGAFTPTGVLGETLSGLSEFGGTIYGASYHDGVGDLFTVNTASGSLTTVGASGINYDCFGATTSGLFATDTDGN